MNEVVFCDYLRRKNSDLSFLQSEARLWCLASPEMASGRDFDKQRTQGHDFVYTYNKKVRSIELRTEKRRQLLLSRSFPDYYCIRERKASLRFYQT